MAKALGFLEHFRLWRITPEAEDVQCCVEIPIVDGSTCAAQPFAYRESWQLRIKFYLSQPIINSMPPLAAAARATFVLMIPLN